MTHHDENPQNVVFQALDAIPGQVWYLLGVATIVASAVLQLMGKKNWADFVGKWPPTFFAVGLYHKLVRPGNEDVTGKINQAASQMSQSSE